MLAKRCRDRRVKSRAARARTRITIVEIPAPGATLAAGIQALPHAIQRMIMPLAMAPVLDAGALAQHKRKTAMLREHIAMVGEWCEDEGGDTAGEVACDYGGVEEIFIPTDEDGGFTSVVDWDYYLVRGRLPTLSPQGTRFKDARLGIHAIWEEAFNAQLA